MIRVQICTEQNVFKLIVNRTNALSLPMQNLYKHNKIIIEKSFCIPTTANKSNVCVRKIFDMNLTIKVSLFEGQQVSV